MKRLTRRVAILIDAIEDDYQASIVRGIAQAGASVQLVCIAGGVVGAPEKDERSRRNFLFELVDPKSFDGIVPLSGALGNQIGPEAFAKWMDRFRATPIVNLGVEIRGQHSIAVDGASGMREVIVHLIKVHNHRRIAFIRGPTTSQEAEERYAAYRDALEEHGIAFDPRLVLQGTWLRGSGEAAVRELFDERGMRIDAVRAIACANDYMALGALEALRERGVAVPSDVALTGFDDIDATRSIVPPLTTVRQPTEQLGREGLRRLVALMNDGDEPLSTKVVARIVERRSCGCAKVDALAGARRDLAHGRSFEAALMERRTLICAELARTARGALFGAGSGWEERLLGALVSDLTKSDSSEFVTAVDQVVVRLQRAGGDLDVCHSILSVLRRAILDCASSEASVVARADDILHAAREMLGESLVRTEIAKRGEMLHQLREFSAIASVLHGRRRQSFGAELEERFRALGIPCMALGLFTEPGKVTERCTCVAAYGSDARLKAPATFRSSDFGPPEIFANVGSPLLVQPLLFEDEPMGLVTCALGNIDVAVHEQMREILGVGLKGLRLADERSTTKFE